MTNTVYTLITGAGSGLGKAFAVECAKSRQNLILIALPDSGLPVLAVHLKRLYNTDIQFFEFDMTDIQHLQNHIDYIRKNFIINMLINNAGIGGTVSILNCPLEVMDKTIQLNMRSTALITRSLLPVLVQQENSYIINIASMAAFTPIAYKTIYPATKAFITSFSLSLREELQGSSVSVSVACPGPIMTNSNTSKRILLQGIKAKLGLVATDAIARLVLKQAIKGKAVIIPGAWNNINRNLMKLLPLQFKIRVVSKHVRKELAFNF